MSQNHTRIVDFNRVWSIWQIPSLLTETTEQNSLTFRNSAMKRSTILCLNHSWLKPRILVQRDSAGLLYGARTAHWYRQRHLLHGAVRCQSPALKNGFSARRGAGVVDSALGVAHGWIWRGAALGGSILWCTKNRRQTEETTGKEIELRFDVCEEAPGFRPGPRERDRGAFGSNGLIRLEIGNRALDERDRHS